MNLKKVRVICRAASPEELERIREELAAALLRGALDGTHAPSALQEVDRELAERRLAALFNKK